MAEDKARVISIRLRRDNEDENRALQIIEKYEKQGYTKNQIIVPAILRGANLPATSPEYIQHQTQTLLVTVSELRDIVNELKSQGVYHPPATRNEAVGQSDEINADDPLVKSLMKRRKR